MIGLVLRYVVPAAYDLLPRAMNSPDATAHMLAIGLQESKFLERRQIIKSGKPGPAAGFWQFEEGGAVLGVLTHPLTKQLAIDVLRDCRYGKIADLGGVARRKAVHALLEHNDVLACCFARLLLFTLPAKLPTRGEVDRAWFQYLEAWRPGKPHPETWGAYFAEAWDRVDDDEAQSKKGAREGARA